MRSLLIFLFILFSRMCAAQDFLQFQYNTDNGLPDNNTYHILQDTRGFMWFCTNAGLVRFDGTNFRTYSVVPDSTSFPALRPTELIETKPGHLAFSCDYKLIRMNTVTHQFFRVPAFKHHKANDIKKVSKNLFIVSGIDTCFVTDENLNIQEIIVPPLRSPRNILRAHRLYESTYLVGNHEEHFLFDLRTKKFEALDAGNITGKNYLFFQYYDSTNQWLYFINYFNGVHRYSLQGKKLKQWPIWGCNILTPISDHILWVGSSAKNGSRLLNLQNDEVTPITINTKTGYEAFHFYTDKQGNHWIATSEGVTRIKIGKQLVKTWESFEENPGNGHFPLAIIKGSDQRLYLSFFELPFLYQLDSLKEQWKLISKAIFPNPWYVNRMDDDLIFTGGPVTRFTVYNPITHSFRISSEFLKEYFPNSDIVIMAFQHSNGDQWFSGNQGGGFVRIRAEDKSVYHYTKDGPHGQFTYGYYTNYVEDDSGDLWFSVNRTSKLLHWTQRSDSFSEVSFDTIQGMTNLPNSSISRIIRDNKNNLWIGFDGAGVAMYDYLHKRGVHYSYNDGLSSGIVNALAFDKKGRLWMGTSKGLSCLLVKENIIRNFSKFDGFKENQFLEQCMYYDSIENKMWVGGNTMVMRFDPDSLLAQIRHEIKVYLDEIYVNGKQRWHNPDVTLNLNFKESNILFRFVAVNLDKKAIQLSYRLDGHDPNWVNSLSATTASYANLAPGTYTFTVKVNCVGDLNQVYVSQPFTFIVATPWFMTWWFRIMVVTGSMVLFGLLIRSYYARKSEKQKLILEKQQAVEKERTRIATDMHDDFGANLSRIKFISEKIKLKTETETPLSQDLTKISAYSDEMAEKMNEIVWALNERYDSLEDLVSFSRAYAADYLQHHAIKLDFTSDINTNQKVKGEVRRNVFLVIKESLHNIVKHAEASQIEISFQLTHQVRVIIRDNGKGFSRDEIRPFANGISNMTKRMQDIGGSFEISGKRGTTIILAVDI